MIRSGITGDSSEGAGVLAVPGNRVVEVIYKLLEIRNIDIYPVLL